MEISSVYLDSNVIIDMADGKEDELIGLILRSIYNGIFCYPFSYEQIAEITQQGNDDRNDRRLVFLSDISRSIYFEHNFNRIDFRKEQPRIVFDSIDLISMAKSFEKDFANIITYEQQQEARAAYGLSNETLNNLSAIEAIEKINTALANYKYEIKEGHIEPPRSLAEMLKFNEENSYKHFSNQWEQIGANPDVQLRDSRIVCLFTLIDLFGFWSDSKSTYVKGSRFADSRHAFNGSYFNKVVSRDKRFLKKSEAAYLYFNISTSTISTEEFKIQLRELLKKKS